LVDEIAPAAEFANVVKKRAEALAAASPRPASAQGIRLNPLERKTDAHGYHYRHVDVLFDRAARTATLTVRAPEGAQPQSAEAIRAAGDAWWPLAMARELEDAILMLRTNELELGLVFLKTTGDAEAVLATDVMMLAHRGDWLVKETVGLLRRTFARLDVTSRSFYAILDEGSCFAGILFELALAADRSYMMALAEDADTAPHVALDGFNFGLLPMVNGNSRVQTRFAGNTEKLAALESVAGRKIGSTEALDLGLVTFTPDELDWEDEIRVAAEERACLSPDALTGMEASLRFPGAETIETKVFGRLSAWQNWVFVRPNATGENGALKLFGTGTKSKFNWERV